MIRNEERNELIKQLRSEALEVRVCFREFSFKAVALSSAVLSIVPGTMDEFPTVVFATSPISCGKFLNCDCQNHEGLLSSFLAYFFRLANKNGSDEMTWHFAKLASRIVAVVYGHLYIRTTVLRCCLAAQTIRHRPIPSFQ